MPEQRENSVLFSLKELRRIEDDRIRQEEADARSRVEAERRAREEAERAARDEIDRRKRDEEDRVRRLEDEKVSREREEQMRLQEAERRARVEGEMQLQQERMRLEIQSKKGHSSMPAVIGVVVVMLVITGGIIYKLNSDAQAERIALQRKAAEEADRIKKESDDQRRRLESLISQKEKELREAKTDDERDRIRT